ncbi:MAG: Ig-like domain-containing protein, partial [Clostridia bacterium]|nr:Ig-like domain-containing protein [Clostridia bacterium]
MNKNKLLRLIAVSTACLSVGVFALAGCKKSETHVHSWKYESDGAVGHHRVTNCNSHATESEGILMPHDGDTCSKCGYINNSGATVPVTKVEIIGSESVKAGGGKIQLTAVITPDNATAKDVTWTVTAGGEFAEIDNNGVLTGKTKGWVTVKATVGGVSDTHEVEVIEHGETVRVTGVELDKEAVELNEGDTVTLVATVNTDNADDKTVTWQSDNAAATVKNGVVTAVSAGTANITVITNDGGKT